MSLSILDKISTLTLLLFSPTPAVAARKEQNEVLSWSYHSSHLFRPMSDMSSTYSLAPNDDGDLGLAIYLLGGCIDHYETKEGSLTEYYCPEISDGTTAFDPDKDLFEKRRNMPRRRYRHGAVSVEGQIWVIGGRDEFDNVILEVDVYDPGWDKWFTVGSLPSSLSVSDHAIWNHQGNIYMAGGYDQNYLAVSTTIVIDADATVNAHGGLSGGRPNAEVIYRLLENMNEARGDVHSLHYGRYGYIVGGFSHVDGYCRPLKSVEIYDTQKNKWMYADELNTGRADTAVMKYKGKFYALGGETREFDGEGNVIDGGNCGGNVTENQKLPRRRTYPVNSVEVYDPLDGIEAKWQNIQGGLPDDMRFRFVLAPWNEEDSIYVFGGVVNVFNSSEGITSTENDCLNCLKLSDVIIEYADEMEESFVLGVPFNLVAAALASALITAALIKAACSARMRRREETRNRRRQNLVDDGGASISMVDMNLIGHDPYRDGEVL